VRPGKQKRDSLLGTSEMAGADYRTVDVESQGDQLRMQLGPIRTRHPLSHGRQDWVTDTLTHVD
jgi:hypothetical protein